MASNIQFTKESAASVPSAGSVSKVRLFIDSADGRLKTKDSAGNTGTVDAFAAFPGATVSSPVVAGQVLVANEILAVGSLSGAVNFDLPALSGVVDGADLFAVVDLEGSATTYAITITPNGAETINGVNAPINLLDDYGTRGLIKTSATNWTIIYGDSSEALPHKATHISGAGDEIDGDQLDIDWSPTNYTPSTVPAEVTTTAHLTAHLAGIDANIVPLVTDSIATLRLIDGPTANADQAYQLRYHTASGDGGGGLFVWDAASTDADDGGITILPTGHVGAGRWVRQFDGPVNVRWFGAQGDGTDDRDAIQAAIDYTNGLGGGEVFIPSTSLYYGINTPLHAKSNVRITGEGYASHIRSISGQGASGLNAVFFLGNLNSADSNTLDWVASTVVAVNDRVLSDSSTWVCSDAGTGTTSIDAPTGAGPYTDGNGVIWLRVGGEPSAGRRISLFGSGVFYETGTVFQGAYTLTFTTPGDGSNFVAGDIVCLKGTEFAYPPEEQGIYISPLKNELNIIDSATANTITLKRPVSITISGCSVRNLSNDDNPTNADILGQKTLVVKNAEFQDLRLTQSLQNDYTFACFSFGGAIDCKVDNVYMDDTQSVVALQALAHTQFTNLKNCRFRHRFVELAYGVHDLTFRDIEGSWKTSGQVDTAIITQLTARNVVIDGFRLDHGAAAPQSLAVTGRSSNIRYSNGVVYSPNTTFRCVSIGGTSGSHTPTECTLDGITVHTSSSTSHAFRVLQNATEVTAKRHIISNCTAFGQASTADLEIDENLTNCKVVNNNFAGSIIATGLSSSTNMFTSNKDNDPLYGALSDGFNIQSSTGTLTADLVNDTDIQIFSVSLPSVAAAEAGTVSIMLMYHMFRAAVPRNFSASGCVMFNASTDDSGNIVVATPAVFGDTESLGAEYSSLVVVPSMIISGTDVIARLKQTNDQSDSCRVILTANILGQTKNSVPRFDRNRLTWLV